MKEKTETFNQGKRYFFYILMFAILGWFIFMQIFGADERSSDTSAASVIYSGTVTWQKPDGTTQEISVPGTYKVPVGDTMVLTIQLPDDLTDTCFAIRSSLQDVDFYVGDNLRTSYSTHKTRLVGKNSASRYVFCPVYASDAGKELRIELTTYTSNYTGVVNPVYCGNKADIWIYIFSRYGLETYIAFFILFAGIVTILFSFALGYEQKLHHTGQAGSHQRQGRSAGGGCRAAAVLGNQNAPLLLSGTSRCGSCAACTPACGNRLCRCQQGTGRVHHDRVGNCHWLCAGDTLRHALYRRSAGGDQALFAGA